MILKKGSSFVREHDVFSRLLSCLITTNVSMRRTRFKAPQPHGHVGVSGLSRFFFASCLFFFWCKSSLEKKLENVWHAYPTKSPIRGGRTGRGSQEDPGPLLGSDAPPCCGLGGGWG